MLGEQLFFTAHGKLDFAKSESLFSLGMWIGRDPDTGSHLIATLQATVKSRTIRRRVPLERWDPVILKELKALPWDLDRRRDF